MESENAARNSGVGQLVRALILYVPITLIFADPTRRPSSLDLMLTPGLLGVVVCYCVLASSRGKWLVPMVCAALETAGVMGFGIALLYYPESATGAWLGLCSLAAFLFVIPVLNTMRGLTASDRICAGGAVVLGGWCVVFLFVVVGLGLSGLMILGLVHCALVGMAVGVTLAASAKAVALDRPLPRLLREPFVTVGVAAVFLDVVFGVVYFSTTLWR